MRSQARDLPRSFINNTGFSKMESGERRSTRSGSRGGTRSKLPGKQKSATRSRQRYQLQDPRQERSKSRQKSNRSGRYEQQHSNPGRDELNSRHDDLLEREKSLSKTRSG